MAMSQLPSVLSSMGSRNTFITRHIRSNFIQTPNSPFSPQTQPYVPLQNVRFFTVEEFSPQSGEPGPAWLKQPWQEDAEGKILVNELVNMGRHTKITAAGRVFSFSASIIIGTGRGTAGFGYGKAATPDVAVQKAQQDAQKNMLSLHFEKGSIPHDIIMNWRGTKVCIFKRRRGFGVKGTPLLTSVAAAFGVSDISLKTHRSRHPNKIVLAMFRGLRLHCSKTPQERAREAGRKYVDWSKFWTPDHEVVKAQNDQYKRQFDRLARLVGEDNIYDPERAKTEAALNELMTGEGEDLEPEDLELDEFTDSPDEEPEPEPKPQIKKGKRYKGAQPEEMERIAKDPTIPVYTTDTYVDQPEKQEDKKHNNMAKTWAEDFDFYKSLKTRKRLKLKDIEESRKPKQELYKGQKKRGY